MALNDNIAVVIRDAVTGHIVGNLTREGQIVRDVLGGDRIGRLAPGMYNSIISETLSGYTIGSHLATNSVIKEVVSGDRIGLNLKPAFYGTIMEVIGRDTSYKFGSTTREVVGQRVGEALSVQSIAPTLRQLVSLHRATPLPSTVHSYDIIAGYRQLVAKRQPRLKPISVETVNSFWSKVAAMRGVPLPRDMVGPQFLLSTGMLVAMSRNQVYTPVSAVYARTEHQLIAQHRVVTVTPPTVRSPIQNKVLAQLIAVTRKSTLPTNDLVAGEQQLVAQRRPMIPYIGVESNAVLSQQIAQRRTMPTAPDTRSPIFVGSDVQLAAMARVPGAEFGMINYATSVQLTAMVRVPGPVFGMIDYAADRQLVAQQRDPAPPAFSTMPLAGYQQLIAQHRAPLYVRPSDLYNQVQRQLVAQQRAPGANPISYTPVAGEQQLVAQQRDNPGILRGDIEVGSVQVMYALFRETPAPGDVVDPDIGHQVYGYRMLAALRRVTEPPIIVTGALRIVSHVASHVALPDVDFGPAGDAYSDAQAFGVMRAAVIGDTFADKGAPYSVAQAGSVAQAVTVGDPSFPSKDAVNSVARVSSLAGKAVVGDPSFPSKDAVNSVVQISSLAAQIALGDDQFTDPSLGHSELDAWSVGAFAAVADVFADKDAAHSDLTVMAPIMFAVVRDDKMLRLPLRENRRRPIITVSIS